MASKISKQIAEEEVEGDMTPMIDVTFLILIFFLVTIKFKTLDAKLQIEMPTSFGSQNTGEVEKPKLAIDMEVVEPGMAVIQKGKSRGNNLYRFLEPADFQLPPVIAGWLRGTMLETRNANMATAQRAGWSSTSATPPKINLREGKTRWLFDKWGRDYQHAVFRNPVTGSDTLPYTAERYPLRLVRYKVREQDPGSPDREIAVCYSLEDLHRVISELYWKYHKQEVDAGLRDRATGKHPDPAKDKEKYQEYKRKSPALIIKTGESTVLAWTAVRTKVPGMLRSDKIRALRYKPRFAPYWLAELTCKDTGSNVSRELVGAPRRIAPFYDSMGWNIQYEDVTEVLDMLHDAVLSRSENQKKEYRPWNGRDSWAKDPKHHFANVFLEQTFAGDSSIGFIPAKFTGPNYVEDRRPFGKLIKPK